MAALISLLLFAAAACWTLSGVAALFLTARRAGGARSGAPSAGDRALPPVTILKPLCGADASLEDNLETFFVQDHPDFEILFGVERDDDPGAVIARRVMARHPSVRARLLVHATRSGLNPKVRNLRGLLPHAAHDRVLISDSNVRARPWTVREMAAIVAAHPDVGMVTSLIAGGSASSLAGQLEAVQMCGFVAAGATLPTRLGEAVVVGKSMLLSRRELERLGGLERVADVLAEDHVLGKTFELAGRRVVVAPTPIENVIGAPSWSTVFERHVRWGMMRSRLNPVAYAAELLTCPLALAPVLLLAMSPVAALASCLALSWVRDVGGWIALRGARDLHVPLALAPIRDLFAIAVWAIAPFRQHLAWRGNKVRLAAGTVLYATA